MNDRIVTSPDGYRWFVGGSDTDDHLALGGHETMLEPILSYYADPDGAFLNVGAHVGLWAIRMAEKFDSVWAVEANPATVRKLEDNIQLNELQNVNVVSKAFWDTDGDIVHMVDENGKETGGSTRCEIGYYHNTELLAQTVSVDTYFNYTSRPSFALITLDVEGAEARVLRGARNTIDRDKPVIIIELHEGLPGVDDDIRAQVYKELDNRGYDYSSVNITGERLICTPYKQAEPETVQADLQSTVDSDIVPLVNSRTGELIYG